MFPTTFAAAAVYYSVFILRSGFRLGGELYFRLFDDAMISMQYARNLAEGAGLVWNRGEAAVEGYTNFLWTVWMALVHRLPLPISKTSLAVMISGAVILIVQLALVTGIVRNLTGVKHGWTELTAVALTAFSYSLVFWTLNGTEVGALSSLGAAGALLAFRLQDGPQSADLVGLSLCLAAMVLIRDDALVIAGVLACYACVVTEPSWRRRIAIVLVAVVGVSKIGHFLFRWKIYGDLLPNTYYLKLGGSTIADRAGRGVSTLAGAAMQSFFPLLLFGGSVLATQGREPVVRIKFRLLAAMFIAQTAYSVYVGGDAWEYMRLANRYVAVALPALLVLTAIGITDVASAPAERQARIGSALAIGVVAAGLWNIADKIAYGQIAVERFVFGAVLIVTGATVVFALLGPWRRSFSAWHVGDHRFFWTLLVLALVDGKPTAQWLVENLAELQSNIEMTGVGLMIRDCSDPGARVGMFAAGNTRYFSERAGVDMLGKSDRHTAMMARTFPFNPGHDKFDPDYSLGVLRPDVVVPAGWGPGGELNRANPWARTVTADSYAERVFAPALAKYGFERLPNGLYVNRASTRVHRGQLEHRIVEYEQPQRSN